MLFGQFRCVIQTRHYVLACNRGVLCQQVFNRVSIREHVHDLMHRNPRSFDASLAVTYRRIDGNPFEWHDEDLTISLLKEVFFRAIDFLPTILGNRRCHGSWRSAARISSPKQPRACKRI